MVTLAKSKFYVTTPIYYVNDVPHIGHAYTTVAADTLARWHRSLGKDVFFLTGTDEHGLKIQRAAEAAGKKPQKFVDGVSSRFKDVFKKLNISYDKFIRTTDEEHLECVKALINKVNETGDIYKGIYEGKYCVDCENYLSQDDIVDNKCKIHNKPVEYLKEESYFFNLFKYQKKLLKLYEQNPKLILPAGRQHEIVSKIKKELLDLSITRTSFDWGVPFPLDKKHITYVWFDALANYISASDFARLKRRRPTSALSNSRATLQSDLHCPRIAVSRLS